MKSKYFITLGALGALMFVIAFVLGEAIVLLSGIQLTGGLVQVILLAIVFAIGYKMFPKFGTFTILSLVFTLIASPFFVFGVPGLYKVVVGLVLGIVVDSFVFLTNKKHWGIYFGTALGFIVSVPMIWYSMKIIGLEDAANKLLELLPVIIVVYAVEGFVGAYLGVRFFEKRLSKLPFIQQLIK